MFAGEDINALIGLLETRGVSLFHACPLVDFRSYLQVDGIPSRALLDSEELPYTAFETDETDQANLVWDKVFVNLSDFGERFARGANNIPNPYGPILFQLRTQALAEASDVAICLWSAGAKNFDREREALASIQDVERLFLYSDKEPFPQKSYIKFRKELKEEFGLERAQDPEVSCTVVHGKLPLDYVSVVWVDPYTICNKPLRDWVDETRLEHGARFSIQERRCQGDRAALYNEIAEAIIDGIPPLQDILQSSSASQTLREWTEQILVQNLEWQFERFARYLRKGTLLPLLEGL